MASTSCSSCGALPCSCCPSTDPVTGCDDPGLLQDGTHLATLDEEFCAKRMSKYRGVDENGDRITDVGEPIQPAFRIQDADGNDVLKSPPCIPYPDFTLAVDANGYGSNGADKLLGRSSDCELDIVGPTASDGFLKWDFASSRWTLAPGIPVVEGCDNPLVNGFALLFNGTADYTIVVSGDTSAWAARGSVVIPVPSTVDGESNVTFTVGVVNKVGDNTYINLTLPQEIADLAIDPINIEAGTCVYWVGFISPDFCGLATVPLDGDGLTEFDGIVVCKDGELFSLAPVAGKAIVGVGTKWRLVTQTVSGLESGYPYTGAQQLITVPVGYTTMTLKLWGALSGDDPPGGYRGGGGYTTLVMTVVAGGEYMLIVGQKGNRTNGGTIFGFGGPAYVAGGLVNASGGGLTGLFTGNTPVVSGDTARAVAIAGGGAGIGVIGGTVYNSGHNAGNDTSGGGSGLGLLGQDGIAGDGNGAGGGGYSGGLRNKGGTGYANPAAISSSIIAGSNNAQANSSDSDFVSQGGNGYAVIIFS